MNYYTYAYLREDGTPYYIGKGTKNRWKRQHTIAVPPRERVLFLKENLTEEEAFRHEIYLISVLGRKDLGTGCLQNRTGGGEGTTGRVIDENQRQRIREKLTGVKHTEERRRKNSEGCKGRVAWNRGKKRTWEGTNPPNQKGKRWFHNPNTGETMMHYNKPSGDWIAGRGYLPRRV